MVYIEFEDDLDAQIICEALAERLDEVLNHGLRYVYMQLYSNDLHISSVLGIARDDWDIIEKYSSLFDHVGRRRREDVWRDKLGYVVVFRTYGYQNKAYDKWVRFCGSSTQSLEVSRRAERGTEVA